MNTTHMILMDGLGAGSDVEYITEIEKVDGVKWVLGLDNLVGSGVPAGICSRNLSPVC